MKAAWHRAGWVMVDPATVLPNAGVLVADGRIQAVQSCRPGAAAVDHGPGVIMPGLVNAHTHLGLSALKGRVPSTGGFQHWVETLMALRASLPEEALAAAACSAAAGMQAAGAALVAEVGALAPGAEAIRRSGLRGLLFLEGLGAGSAVEPLPEDERGLFYSWAGHAPHTTSPEKLRALKCAAASRGRPFGLHLAESEEETAFLASGRGPWADLMARRGHDLEAWGPWGERPVARALRLGLLDAGTLAVHLLTASREEIRTLAGTGCRVCLCPRSNSLLHGRLPDVEAMLESGIRPALGTDSLASTPTLDLFDEMRFMVHSLPEIDPREIVAMATLNGAEVLGMGGLGHCRPGALGRLLYVDLEARTPREVLERLAAGSGRGVSWCLDKTDTGMDRGEEGGGV